MNRFIFVLTLLASLVYCATAQEGISRPFTVRQNPQTASAPPVAQRAKTSPSTNLLFCPPKTCLYYAGDFDSANSDANGLGNGYATGLSLEGWVWAGVKPPKAATVTGVTFNQLFTSGFGGTNPTPFQTQIGITEGNAGKLVCNTSGNATLKQYGESDFGYVQYSYTVKKLAQRCKVQAGSKGATYVNLLPTSYNGFGYLVNVEDAKPKNHEGWKNDLNDCFYTVLDGVYYVTCNSQGMGSTGFSEFSIALTGKETY